jgi:hypothetical protein
LWFHHAANVKIFYISAKYHPAFFYRICIVFTNFTVSNSKIENMKLGKWIGGIMGFMAMGPLGALAGYT